MDTYNALMAVLREIEPFGWMIVLLVVWFGKSGLAKDFAALSKDFAALSKNVAKDIAALSKSVAKDIAGVAEDVAKVDTKVDRANARIDEYLGKPREATESSAPSVVIRAEHLTMGKPEADAVRMAVSEVHQSVPEGSAPVVEPPVDPPPP